MIPRMGRFALAVVTTAVVAGTELAAQQTPDSPQPGEGNRAALQARMRERIGGLVKERLGLNDQQMAQLQQVNTRFEESRRLLVEQERDLRMAMRDELLAGEGANQTRVGEHLERLLRVQRQRLDLIESEQRELAKFMTPVQRAKYLALQDQMRRRVQELRQRGEGGPRGGRANPRTDGPRRPGGQGDSFRRPVP